MMTIEEILNIIEKTIHQLNLSKNPVELYEPIKYALDNGGKRIRPLLLMLSYLNYRENIEEAIKPAIGIEIFHNFTLLHDDIMDKADTRRGKPTVHKKWNQNVAILSGDAMMIYAYSFFLDLQGNIQRPILELFTNTALQVCEGQQYDMNFEQRKNVSIDEYMEMIRLKTAVLLATSLKMGSMIGNAPDNDSDLFYNVGINMGLAFQLQDDYLDVYGQQEVFGKRIGGDIATNKKTFLLISALEKANQNQRSRLMNLLNEPNIEKKIKEVTELYNEIGVDKDIKEKIKYYSNKAVALLDEISNQRTTHQIKSIIIKLINRNN